MEAKLHTWAWLIDRAVLASDVSALQELGFGKAKVIPIHYEGKGEKKRFWLPTEEQDRSPYERTAHFSEGNARKEKKIIAFNRGQQVRVIPYARYLALELGLENKEK